MAIVPDLKMKAGMIAAYQQTKKGDKTQEKSLAEESELEEQLTEQGKYERAIAECAGHFPDIAANPFVESVLKSLHKELQVTQEKLAKAVEDSARAHKNRNSAMVSASNAKAKGKKNVDKIREETGRKIEELEAEIKLLKNQA